MKLLFFLSLFISLPLLALDSIEGKIEAKDGLNDYSSFIIYIETKEKIPTKKEKVHIIDQKNKKFSPSVLGIRTGDKVNFVNKDDYFHNVFSLDPKNKFDLGLYKGDRKFSEDKKKEVAVDDNSSTVKFIGGGKVQVFCNIHQEMTASIYMFDHPYFAQVKKDGSFSLKIPSGAKKINLVLEGEQLAKKMRKVLKSKKKIKILFKASENKKEFNHTKKDGKPYEEDWSVDEDEFY